MYASGKTDELRKVSLGVKGFILRNPGLSYDEIIVKLPQEYNDRMTPAIIRQMRNSGMVIVRNDQYYALGHSVKAKAKRHRQKLRKTVAAGRHAIKTPPKVIR